MPKYTIETKERTNFIVINDVTIELTKNKATVEFDETEAEAMNKIGEKAGFVLTEIKPKKVVKKTTKK